MPSLNRLYTQALRILGVEAPGADQLALGRQITPVTILADVSDVVEPHQNPVFGVRSGQTAVAAAHGVISVEATSRPIRIWGVHIEASDAPRIMAISSNIIDANQVELLAGPLAPVGVGAAVTTRQSTAICRSGTFAAAAIPAAVTAFSEFTPLFPGFWNPLLPMLVAPGTVFTTYDETANDIHRVGIVFEEIPRQQELPTGFPT